MEFRIEGSGLKAQRIRLGVLSMFCDEGFRA